MWMFSCLCVFFGAGVFTTTHAQHEENLALRGQAVQSSTYSTFDASKAIDTSLATCITTSTSITKNPWWRVDLLDSYYISRVVITNRADCCVGRIDGAEIHIGNSLVNNGNNNTRCGVLYDVALGQAVSVSCGDIKGRYVNVFLPGSSRVLTMCDVKVFAVKVIKGFIRIKFNSSLDMSDPAERNNVLNELKTALTSKGFSVFTLNWSKLPQKIKPET